MHWGVGATALAGPQELGRDGTGMVTGTLGPICFWIKASCLCLENLEAIQVVSGMDSPGTRGEHWFSGLSVSYRDRREGPREAPGPA